MTTSTRERILDAARRTLFDDANASIDDIAAAAGVGRATVFRHFGTREGLMKTLAQRAIAETDRAAEHAMVGAATAAEALRRIVVAAVEAGDHYRFLGNASELFADPELNAEYERQLRELRDLVESAKSERCFRRDLPTAWIVRVIDGQIWSACVAIAKGEVGAVQAQEMIWDAITAGLGPRTTAMGGSRDAD